MTEADLVRIETALGNILPRHYRQFMVHHGNELRAIKEALPMRAVIDDDPDEIINHNTWARASAKQQPPWPAIGEDQRPWPTNYVMVGTNGGGDYWYIHLDGSEKGLWFWSHESCEIVCDYPTLEEYLASLKEDLQDAELWQDLRPPEWQ